MNWSVDNQCASINKDGLFIPLEYGVVTVTATSKGDPSTSVSQSVIIVKTIGQGLTLIGERNLIILQEYDYLLEEELPVLVDDYFWVSNTPAILEVISPGLLKAVGVGEASILITSKVDHLQEITVAFIIDYPTPTSIQISGQSSLTLGTSSTSYLATVLPSETDQNVIWSNSNPNVAYISEDGVVTPLTIGTTTITATSTLNPLLSESLEIVINRASPQEVIIHGLTDLTLSSVAQYSANVLPSLAPQAVVWSTSNSNIATINTDGQLMILHTGEVEIIATSQVDTSIRTSYRIVVSYDLPQSITIDGLSELLLSGATSLYTASVLPMTALQLFTWSSLNPLVATIDQTGLLTIIQTGTVTIRATSTALDSIFQDYLINISFDAPITLTINGNSELFYADASTLYTAVIEPVFAVQTVEWSSNNINTGIISQDGVLTITGVGTRIIKATSLIDHSIYSEITLTVKPDLPSSVLINGPLSLFLGESDSEYHAEVLPLTALQTGSWSIIEGSSLVEIDENGEILLVHAIQEGSVTICFTSVDSSVYLEKSITVSLPHAQNIIVTSEIYDHQIYLGESFLLEWELTPSLAVQQVTFSSNNPTVVSVSNAGLITALSVGEALITITSQDGFASLEVEFTVYNPLSAAQAYFQGTEDNYLFTVGRIEYSITPWGLKSRNLDTWEVAYEVYNETDGVVEMLKDASVHPSEFFTRGIYRTNIIDLVLFRSLYASLNFSWNSTQRHLVEIKGGLLYRLAQKQYPDATLKLTVEISNGVVFSNNLQAKYYYGGLEINSSALMLGQTLAAPEYFCRDYLDKQFPLDGELVYLELWWANYRNLMTRLGFPIDYVEQLNLTQNEDYWIWFKAVPDGVSIIERRQFFGGYELRMYDYENSEFLNNLQSYYGEEKEDKLFYWTFNYLTTSSIQKSYIQKSYIGYKEESDSMHLWIYQSRRYDVLSGDSRWNFIPKYSQIFPFSIFVSFYDEETRTITIWTKNNAGDVFLQEQRSDYLDYLQNGLKWSLNDYYLSHLYVSSDGGYGIVVNEITIDSYSGLSYFSIQLLINPPIIKTSLSPVNLTLPEKYQNINLSQLSNLAPWIPFSLTYADGYPTLLIDFSEDEGNDFYYFDLLMHFLMPDWNPINDPTYSDLYEYRYDPTLRLLLINGEIFTVKFFRVLIERNNWPETELNSFMGINLPKIFSNPSKYHFSYDDGIVHMEFAEGYQAEISSYVQFYLSVLGESFWLNRIERTPWSQIYDFGDFELEVRINSPVVDFIFRQVPSDITFGYDINLHFLFPEIGELDFFLDLSGDYNAVHYVNKNEVFFFPTGNGIISRDFYESCVNQLLDHQFYSYLHESIKILINYSNSWIITISAFNPTTGGFSLTIEQVTP